MIPLVVLVASSIAFRLAGLAGIAALGGWQPALRAGLAVMFALTASAHWGRKRADLVRMVPPAFRRPEMLVTLTGILELLGALGLVIPATATPAAIGLALLLVAMFPANIYAARQGLAIGGRPVTALRRRTVIQIVFLVAAIAAGWPG